MSKSGFFYYWRNDLIRTLDAYAITVISGTQQNIQLRHTADDQQAFLIFGAGSATKTVLAIASRYRSGTSNPTVHITSLGEITVTTTTSSGNEKYLQINVGSYFQGCVLSNRQFTLYTF